MRRWRLSILAAWALCALLAVPASAADIKGVREHPMVKRYPGQEIRWQQIDNYRRYRVPVGPVTGYRAIGKWIDTEGRVTRTFYRFQGKNRTHAEIYQNYLDALASAGFETLAQGILPDRKGTGVGSTQWLGVYIAENPLGKRGDVDTLTAGTSSQGGAGAIVARKKRPEGDAYVIVNVEQHAADYVGALIDIIEVKVVQSGLIAINAEAIGRDIKASGRVVLDGVLFDFDKATLKPESKPALDAIAQYLKANPDRSFYVVGHTDAVGSLAYNLQLSGDRARAVVKALASGYGIAAGRLDGHGVGPLVPAFSNASDAGRDKNRRVELVERRE